MLDHDSGDHLFDNHDLLISPDHLSLDDPFGHHLMMYDLNSHHFFDPHGTDFGHYDHGYNVDSFINHHGNVDHYTDHGGNIFDDSFNKIGSIVDMGQGHLSLLDSIGRNTASHFDSNTGNVTDHLFNALGSIKSFFG